MIQDTNIETFRKKLHSITKHYYYHTLKGRMVIYRSNLLSVGSQIVAIQYNFFRWESK